MGITIKSKVEKADFVLACHAAGFAPHDIQMIEKAAQTPSSDEVTSWVGTSQQRVVDDKLEIERVLVSREFLQRPRPGKLRFIMKPDFYGHFLSWLVTNNL